MTPILDDVRQRLGIAIERHPRIIESNVEPRKEVRFREVIPRNMNADKFNVGRQRRLNEISHPFNCFPFLQQFEVMPALFSNVRIGAFLTGGEATELTMPSVDDFSSKPIGLAETILGEGTTISRRD